MARFWLVRSCASGNVSPDLALWAQALTSVIERSEATTMMGLEKELKEAAQSLERRATLLALMRFYYVACTCAHDSLDRASFIRAVVLHHVAGATRRPSR